MRFVLNCVAAAVTFAVVGSGASAVLAQSGPALEIEDFLALPDMSGVRLSPNGERLVFISGQSWEERAIVVYTLDGSEPPLVIDAGDDQAISVARFASDTHLWLEYTDRGNWWGMGDDFYVSRPYIMRIEDQRSIELEVYTYFAGINEENPDTVLTWVRAQRAGGGMMTRVRGGVGYGLFEQDLDRRTGRSRVEIGVRDFDMSLGPNDRPVIRQRGGRDASDPYEFWARSDGGTGSWERLYTERHQMMREFSFAARTWHDWLGVIEWVQGVDPTGRYAYFFSETNGTPTGRMPGRRRALFRMDLQTSEIEGPIVQSDIASIGSTLVDWRTNGIIGASWDDGRRQVEYFEPEFAEVYNQLIGFFPESNVSLVSWDRAFDKVVIYIEAGGTAGAYYLLTRSTGDVMMLGNSRSRIPDAQVGNVSVVRYQAADGVDLFGYLTTPAQTEARDLPLIMMPHGGPESRDSYGFDEWAQLLASRGYAVFQPQFRGSGGFGVEFAELGYQNWGESMQTDLNDGIDHLAAEGIIDPDRVCIFGWSYGGYATLAGMTLTPDRYRCGVAGAGVSDILGMMDYAQERMGGGSQLYWARNIGDWRGDNREHIISISPARQAAEVQAPLMIIHGTEDIVVPYSQAELMVEAMEEAGKPYEFIPIEGGRHYSAQMTDEHRRLLYENLVRFVEEHNPPGPLD